MGVKVCYVTLHVGLGTFRPVKEEEITDHEMHSEYCMISAETAETINRTKREGGRVICVGTTSCRTIESWAAEDGTLKECAGWTNIFIYPGYRFKALDCLITNFHLPESTLIMLVSALAGREHVWAAYKEAVEQRYRFFSFGDAMFTAESERKRETGVPTSCGNPGFCMGSDKALFHQKVMGDIGGVSALEVYLGVHGGHCLIGDAAVQQGEHLLQLGILVQTLLTDKVDRVVGREEAGVILQLNQVKLGEEGRRWRRRR